MRVKVGVRSLAKTMSSLAGRAPRLRKVAVSAACPPLAGYLGVVEERVNVGLPQASAEDVRR
jgi:hypothetical protein